MDKLKKYRQRAILLGISAVLIFLLGFTNTGRLSLHVLDRFLLDVTQPVQTGLARIGQGLGQGATTLVHLPKLYRENKALEKEVAALADENRKLNQIIGQTDYLRAASEVKKSTDYKLVEARVIGKDPSNYFSNFEINRGKKDGVKKDATVLLGVDDPQGIVAQGLVGRVVDVGDNWAKVTAIINENQSVAFKNIRNQEGGILAGKSGDLLWGYSYDDAADIVPGDRLISSGVGDLYKGDVYLGTVDKVKRDEEKMIQEISLKPAVNFKKIYQVFVVVD